ncbi:MAG: RsmE family RNA methyltransferase, partial [Thermoanaerobaculia bacterium]|nr:RsmE family RNA methyltransferase [Thermoanaerobaculia bacterium]
VEKATELGVVAVRFVSFARSERSPGRGTRKRFLRVARAAVEQCGRSRLPEVTMDHELEEIEAWSGDHDETWWLDVHGDRPPRRAESSTRALLLVGPEGGWEPEERRCFREWDLPCVSLGSTTLRIETAAITASALLLAAP